MNITGANFQPSLVILNLGCGPKTSSGCINIDWSIYLRIKKSRIACLLAPLVLRGCPLRLERLRALDDSIMVHDLRRGVPFGDSSVDVVYHSHLLEHIDRQSVERFLKDVWRVLRPGGIHRIVVPDMEKWCRSYMDHLARCVTDREACSEHDSYISDLVLQMVRTESYGVSQQPPLRRAFENVLLGSARRRGELHRWMYDKVNLGYLLERAGFREPRVKDYLSSAIPDWKSIGLDQDESGKEYKPESLYMEAYR